MSNNSDDPTNKRTTLLLLQKAQTRLSAVKDTLLLQNQPPSPIIPYKFPPFDALPQIPSQPQGSLWTFFGAQDELGTLNLLTPRLIAHTAATEIKTGRHIQLDWCLSENVQFPAFGRRKFTQKVIAGAGKHVGFDDEVTFNTQSGSQWDGFKHFGHQKTRMYYNGLSHDEALRSTRNGIHRWCENGGIVGRGVLVDWLRWYEKTRGSPPSPVSRHEIPVADLEECLKWQGTTMRPGDILLVRSGYTRWHNLATEAERRKGTQEQALSIGLENNERSVRWLYDHHFAAVAGDTMAFEAWPPPWKSGWVLHEWLLVQWGTPIGELWNLEELSEMCEREQRWTYFLTSAPLHVKGGVGSPPGAIAIF
ncbi:hypothetical protein MYCGRDRAFT_92237 [Lecanosticta acicola]|uniref:Cyclase n=1 Tax=Lecanosticta acicola TaxID=111012 RepID=A0AAI8Z6E1_9PEZI|nr:hypothetical protein MYCGRDRAFT_92237 [Lecanosticta acicola]